MSTQIEIYIKQFPSQIQKRLREIRKTILKCSAQIEEGFAYQMPSYKIFGKPLVYFAGFQNHIGFYATASGHTRFAKQLAKYKQGKGSVQFSNNEILPVKLIEDIVLYRIEENKNAAKKTCRKGHVFYKTSDCPTCPECEKIKSKEHPYFSSLAAPAQRALTNAGITKPSDLKKYSEKEILALHGFGKSSIPKLKAIMKAEKIEFRMKEKN